MKNLKYLSILFLTLFTLTGCEEDDYELGPINSPSNLQVSVDIVGADDLRFKRPAIPGDRLNLNSKVLTNKKGIWKFECSATVEDDLVAKATILCADRPK